MSREIPEWIGATDDTAIPRRVRVRLFLLADGHCANCSRKLHAGDEWQADHKIALINGGANRESNLQVLCEWCHKPKTVFDVAQKAATYRKRSKHLGVKRAGRTIAGRRFNGDPIPSRMRT
jgi:5-methylcytosine-specific restriction endonuclease McrA